MASHIPSSSAFQLHYLLSSLILPLCFLEHNQTHSLFRGFTVTIYSAEILSTGVVVKNPSDFQVQKNLAIDSKETE